MVKRSVDSVEDGAQAYQKRQRISGLVPTPGKEVQTHGDIQSGKQLRQILTFDQDAGRSKRAIDTLKAFLDSISSQQPEHVAQTSILKDYLESQKPADDADVDHVYLTDVMQIWEFAAQSNNESLQSAVTAVLANLLKTISNILDLNEYGLRIGRTILQKPRQELVARGLSAQKGKEHVISPALRLVRELIIFDGGSLAKQVFRARDRLFKSLSRNLLIRLTGDAVEDRRRPSVRTNAVRVVLACVKFLPVDARREMLNQRDIISALTRDIRDDPSFVVLEVLETLKTFVLKDDGIPREAKTKVVNALSLSRFATLYRYEQAIEDLEGGNKSVEDEAHAFLLLACTNPNLGVLNRQAGFYPRGIDPDDGNDIDGQQSFIDLGLESIEWMDRFKDKVPVRNTILSDVIQNLKPWSSIKQSELLLAIFKAAPELVADYFYNKKSFSFDPKLTATWIGYSAFLYSAVHLTIPRHFGHSNGYARLPPPTSVVLESILPQPLNQKALTRCLNQPHKLITFFAIRILVIAFQKLETVLEMYKEAAIDSSSVWTQAADSLITEFCMRCPAFEDLVKAFRTMEETDLMQREAASRLLVLYYSVVPRIALIAKFDVSESLTRTLQAVEDTEISPEDRAMLSMELENLFQFASFSPGMKWFAKSEGLSMSPFMAMLKMSAQAPDGLRLQKLRSVLGSVIDENQLLQTQTAYSALDCLILRLKDIAGSPDELVILQFLDNCITRCASTPIKYIFSLEQLQGEKSVSDGTATVLSLLTMAILEQWPFLIKTSNEEVLRSAASFLSSYLAGSLKIGEDTKIIKTVVKQLAAGLPNESPSRKIIERSRKEVDSIALPQPKAAASVSKENAAVGKHLNTEELKDITSMLDDIELLKEDRGALVRWTNKEVDEIIDAGHAASLVMLLSSEILSVRKEAAINISKLASKFKGSSHEEKEQIWLLLSEVVETGRKVIDSEPLTTIISSFASNALSVLVDPLHCLYPKINKFLSQGPVWELQKIPLMYKILDEAPSLDDAHYTEIEWLLKYLLAGLRTEADLSILHKRRAFEKLFSLFGNPYLAPGLREKIMRLLFKATTIEGGSTTLITRFSSMTWLDAQIALSGGTKLNVLMDQILATSEKSGVDRWKRGARKIEEN